MVAVCGPEGCLHCHLTKFRSGTHRSALITLINTLIITAYCMKFICDTLSSVKHEIITSNIFYFVTVSNEYKSKLNPFMVSFFFKKESLVVFDLFF